MDPLRNIDNEIQSPPLPQNEHPVVFGCIDDTLQRRNGLVKYLPKAGYQNRPSLLLAVGMSDNRSMQITTIGVCRCIGRKAARNVAICRVLAAGDGNASELEIYVGPAWETVPDHLFPGGQGG